MTAKNASERHKKLLKQGFFPPELPPAFNSEDLALHRSKLKNAFEAIPKVKGQDAVLCYQSKTAAFRFPRFQSSDRRHSITNPIGFFELSRIISEHYVFLRAKSKASKVSSTPLMFDWEGSRAIKRPIFEVRDRFLEYLVANFEFSLLTDISSFYHSIYTHSIPWAIHGKKLSKQKKTDLNLVGNLIDRLVRNAQDGQTIGLPVGPDTSRIIAEILASAIDVQLQKKLKKMDARASRLVDDFAVGCGTRGEAEKVLALIRSTANSFELELNSQKSMIVDNSKREETGWKDLIRSYVPASPYSNADMRSFFFQVTKLQESLPSQNIMKFSIGNARIALANASDWRPTQQFLISAYKNNSTLVSQVVEILIQRQKLKHDLVIPEIQTFLSSRLPRLGEQLRNGEASWLLYLARVLNLPLPAKSLVPFFSENDSLMSLQISEADKASLILGKVNYNYWNSFLDETGLTSEMWLYAYESTLLKTNKSAKSDSFVTGDSFFGPLFAQKVSFYKPSKNQPELSATLKSLKRENAANKVIAESFAGDFDDEEYPGDFDDFDETDLYELEY